MINKNKVTERSGIHDTVKSLSENLRKYIEAQYHIRDEGLIAERRALLQQNETIAQAPYIEATPIYELVRHTVNCLFPKQQVMC